MAKKLKYRIHTSQNKCIHFYLQLDKITHISHEECETLNWLPLTERFNLWINSIVFKYVNDECPNYLNEVFRIAPKNRIQTRGSFLKFKMPLPRNHHRSNRIVQKYEAKPLTRLSEQKISTHLNIIYRIIIQKRT